MTQRTVSFRPSDLTLQDKLNSLPPEPGIYQFKDSQGTILYIGKARLLKNRVKSYFQKSKTTDPRIEKMKVKIADVELIITDSEVEALILEANLVKKHSPRYNVLLKDDKSYPYIVVTNEEFPRVFLTRRIIKDGSKYFGPYVNVVAARIALKAMREIFMIRSCNFDLNDATVTKKKYKICLDYHIKKCGGPCEGLVSKAQYRTMIDQIESVLHGKTEPVLSALESEMKQFASALQFEHAALCRDRIRALQEYDQKQKVVDPMQGDRDLAAVAIVDDDACGVLFKIRNGKLLGSRSFFLTNAGGKSEPELLEALLQQYYLATEDLPSQIVLSQLPPSIDTIRLWLNERNPVVTISAAETEEDRKLLGMVRHNALLSLHDLEMQRLKRNEFLPNSVLSLQRDLRLKSPPKRIECFDISNFQGSDTVASMVVFVEGKPKKSQYRKYKIESVEGPDDFASMREAVDRRYRRALKRNEELPDLIIIDGGKGQLSSAVSVLDQCGLRDLAIIGLAKRLEEVFLPTSQTPLLLPRTSSSLRLLRQIRDEAHRFAVTYHRALRTHRVLSSELDLIKGIGKTRAKELLEAFGSVQGIKFATREQIAEIVGEKTSEKIAEHFDLPNEYQDEND